MSEKPFFPSDAANAATNCPKCSLMVIPTFRYCPYCGMKQHATPLEDLRFYLEKRANAYRIAAEKHPDSPRHCTTADRWQERWMAFKELYEKHTMDPRDVGKALENDMQEMRKGNGAGPAGQGTEESP